MLLCLFLLVGCSKAERRLMEVTAYCRCGKCCDWERGSGKYLKLNFWKKYISAGPQKGEAYTGRTASGVKPHQKRSGLISLDSLKRPWVIPFRILPWRVLPRKGTIAADTNFYPFGTKLYVPGYGWGIVEDRGDAIKGPARLDVFIRSHRRGNIWGRQKVNVKIVRTD